MSDARIDHPNTRAALAWRFARQLGRAVTPLRRAPITVMPAYEPSIGYNELIGMVVGTVLGAAVALPIFVICVVKAGFIGAVFGAIPAALGFQLAYLVGRYLWPLVFVLLIVAGALIGHLPNP